MLDYLKHVRDNYVINHAESAAIPVFKSDKAIRYHIIFSGRVQHVGFRLEVERLALRLELTGWVKNLENNDVEMEIQGMENRITFLLDFMKSLKRIKINRIEKRTINYLEREQNFKII